MTTTTTWRQLSDAQARALRKLAGGGWELVYLKLHPLRSHFVLREVGRGEPGAGELLNRGTARVLWELHLVEQASNGERETVYRASALGRSIVPANAVTKIGEA